MQHILFVEDNEVLRHYYGIMLPGGSGLWETATVADGEAALALMAQRPFDVLVTDFHMPGINGVELVRRVRALYPQTSRILISGIGNQKQIADALGETHQFLAKPFDVKMLKGTLTRIKGLEAYLSDPALRAVVGRLGALPSFPGVYLEIRKRLNLPATTISDVAELIEQDPSMAAKVLQVANSAAIGLPEPVHSPFEAVQQLGMNTVRSLALSAHVFQKFEKQTVKKFSTRKLWEHLMATAMLAKKIMELEGGSEADIEDAYTAGMLHDIGKLMLADNLPNEFQFALTLAELQKIPLHMAEQEIFSANHAGIAGYLLGLWGLSAPIVEAVALHHTPEKTELLEPSPLMAVHVANALTITTPNGKIADITKPVNMDYLEKIGMADRLETWRQLAAMPPIQRETY
jgi:HD-like signal output (HDOD) protein